jgi:hypothetical protein
MKGEFTRLQLAIMRSNYNIVHYAWLTICCLGVGSLVAIISSNRSLWTDELYMLVTVRRPFMEGLLQLQDYSAPMYQLILRLIVHNNVPPEWIVRAPAFLFAMFGLVSIWWLAKTLFNNRVADLTVFIVAFNPVFLRYATEGRPYTMFLFFSVLSVGTFYKFMLNNSHYYLFMYVCSTVLLIYSHYYGLLILPAEILLFLTYMILNRKSHDFKKIFFAFSAVVLLSIPALWLISRYILTGAPSVFSPARMWLEITNLKDFFLVDKVIGLFYSKPVGILCVSAFIVAALITYYLLKNTEFSNGILQKWHFESWHSCYFSTLTCFFWIGTSLYSLLVISFFFKPIYHVRYVFPAMVPFAILLSAVTCNMRRSIQILFLVLIVASYIHQNRIQLSTYYDLGEAYPKMISWLRQANHDKDLVYVTNDNHEHFISSEEYGLHYYGYNQPNVVLLNFLNNEIQEPRLLQIDEHYYVVDFMYRDQVEEYLKRSSRGYKKMNFGHLNLFEVNKLDVSIHGVARK